jgi:hypothetical protein
MITAPWLVSAWIATLALEAPEFSAKFDLKGARSRAEEGTSMFLVLWEFEVKPSSEKQFEKIYSSGGGWDSLFRRDSNHIESRLFRDISRPRVYITMDLWASAGAYRDFLAANDAEYQELDAACKGLTSNERHFGSWELPAS